MDWLSGRDQIRRGNNSRAGKNPLLGGCILKNIPEREIPLFRGVRRWPQTPLLGGRVTGQL
jgi:hypothetical protein